jgi:hypothetical protein
MPSLANCLQMRLAAGESFPRVNPCAKTPQPLTVLAGWSIRPASRGPLVLANHTRSATSDILTLCSSGSAGCPLNDRYLLSIGVKTVKTVKPDEHVLAPA